VDAELNGTQSTDQDTSAAEDDFSPSCGSGSAPDVAVSWTSPATNYYTFSTAGSSFDTIVAVLDGCDGAELDCNNNAGTSPQGVAIARVEKDQSVVVVVDGNSGDRGSVVLNVQPVTCPTSDVTDQPLPAVLSTVGGVDEHDGVTSGYDCGGAGGLEKTIRWVAPSAGMYRFSVSSEDFSPALYLYLGAACGGKALQCNRNVIGGHPAEVARWLEAGQAVTAVVESDGEGGEFTFDVEAVPTNPCASLPELADVSGVSLTTANGSRVLSPSCSVAGNAYVGHYPEHAFRFTVDLNAVQSCSVNVELEGTGGAVYLLPGTQCAAEEVQCSAAHSVNFDFFGNDTNGEYTLVIENQDPFESAMTYSIINTCVPD
jgi:hypothetical protein